MSVLDAPDGRLAARAAALRDADLGRRNGRVVDVIGLVVEATGLRAEVGELCHVHAGRLADPVPAEVVGFRSGRTLLMPLGELAGVGPGTTVSGTGHPFRVPVGDDLLGRDSGSGVGKSSLLGMIARSTTADVNVIALVGERGREVREFVERDLGDALGHSVVVCATSDQPALVRIRAAYTATAIAEHFRDQGRNVVLMMDSVTRFAMAQREVGLAIGEPPATRGYTPSVFAALPKLLERSGTAPSGSITGLYTVLVDGDDMNEPIADAVRSILDGHVVLSRELAHRNHYPAIDVLASVSRLVGEVTGPEERAAAGRVRALLADFRDREDLIAIGAYQHGSDPRTDAAIAMRDAIEAFLRQAPDERSTHQDADAALLGLARRADELAGVAAPDPAAAPAALGA